MRKAQATRVAKARAERASRTAKTVRKKMETPRFASQRNSDFASEGWGAARNA